MNSLNLINSADLNLTPEQKYVVMLHLMTQFSAAIGHKAYVPGTPKTHGNLCMVLVGETGCGKGLAHTFASSLFEPLQHLPSAQITHTTTATGKELIRDINNNLATNASPLSDKHCIYHVNENFGGAFAALSNPKSRLPDYLCKLIDGRQIQETFGRQYISYPYIHYSLMGHLTPLDIQQYMKEQCVAGGYAGRFIWVPVPKDMPVIFPEIDDATSEGISNEIYQSILYAWDRDGVEMDCEATILYNSFLYDIQQEQMTSGNLLIKSIITRFPLHVKKISLVLSLMRRKHKITTTEVSEAISLVSMTRSVINDYFMPALPACYEYIILKHIRQYGKVKEAELIQELSTQGYKPAMLKKSLDAMRKTGVIKYKREEQDDGTFPFMYSV